MITILGTGLLGSGFAHALRRQGAAVRVWNRSPDKARALARIGATPVADPAEAVRGAERTHIAVSDDAAVDAVLAAAAPGWAPGALVVDHTTTSTAGARERTARWRERGVVYQHVPVFMGPQNAADSTGLMLISGDREVVARVSPMLATMTGKLVDLGPRVDAAAAHKLLGNLFLMALTAGLSDVLALAQAMDVRPEEVATLFDHFNPGAAVPARLRRILDADFGHPSWELLMARKDARLMQAEADAADIALSMLPAFAAQMDRSLAEGDGHADWTVVAKGFVAGSERDPAAASGA
ncbi:MAG TPA: NAD(P)-binding domain-containing protein [Planctomycetota bacterium]|nr:NAD(P)-binding domain-containing protein [Planctomycetota bacterium]